MNLQQLMSELPPDRYEKYAKFLRWRLKNADVVAGGKNNNGTFRAAFRLGTNTLIKITFKIVYVTRTTGNHGGEHEVTELDHYEITSMGVLQCTAYQEFPQDMLKYMHANRYSALGARLTEVAKELAGVPKLGEDDAAFAALVFGTR